MYLLIFLKKIEWRLIQFFKLKKFKSVWVWVEICFWVFSDAGCIDIGDYVYIGEWAIFHAAWWISIWSWTIIWPNVLIRSSNHPYKNQEFIPYGFWIEERKVFIWENCWIWEWVKIIPWTVIWEWSIIWMWAVVGWNIPPMSIVVWNPWKVIKTRDIVMYQKAKEKWNIYLKHKFIKK